MMMQQGGLSFPEYIYCHQIIPSGNRTNYFTLPTLLDGDLPLKERFYIKYEILNPIGYALNYSFASTLIGYVSGWYRDERTRGIRITPTAVDSNTRHYIYYNYPSNVWGHGTRASSDYNFPMGIHECDVTFPNLNNGVVTQLNVNGDYFNYGQLMVNGANLPQRFIVGDVMYYGCVVRIYRAKRWINDVLVFDLVPFEQNGIGCLMNQVDGVCYYADDPWSVP